MDRQKIIEKIRHIQIETKRLLAGTIAGDYNANQKGFGLEFDQLRDYQYGDDLRFVDWKSSARVNKLIYKQYFEQRNRNIFLLIDISKSYDFGSTDRLKSEVMAEVATVLCLTAEHAKDAVSIIFFSDDVEYYIPPGSSKSHIFYCMNKVYAYKAASSGTNIKNALRFLAQLKKNDSIVFLISDFIDSDFQKELALIHNRSELVLIRCLDNYEYQLPSVGQLALQDPETGEHMGVDFNHMQRCSNVMKERLAQQNAYFLKNGIDCFDVVCDSPFIDKLIYFFKKRMRR